MQIASSRLVRIATAVVTTFVCLGNSVAKAADAAAPKPASVTIRPEMKLGTIDPLIFGHFTEETLTSWEGGVSSELLVDRKFSVPEIRDVAQPWVKGTGGGWEPIQLASNVTLVQDEVVYYSAPMAQRISNSGGEAPAGVQQAGFRMVMPHVSKDARISDPFTFRAGERYKVRLTVKNLDLRGDVHVALGESPAKAVAHHRIPLHGGEDWKTYTFELAPNSEARDARFMIYIDTPGTIWIDSASLVRADLDQSGFRKDIIRATRQLLPTNIRWPGGWFVSDYHWQDGLGPIDKRPARRNRAWDVVYNNDVGIDEYIAFCRAVGAEPYIVVNVGTGSPTEAAALVEYVNAPADTRWGRVRVRNGHREPYKVRLWNIGNEEYLPTLGGRDGKAYATTYLEFARAMRKVDPSIKIVAVGAPELPKGILPANHPLATLLRYLPGWGADFLPLAGGEADYYAFHYYEPGDTMKGEYTAEDFQRAAMVIAEDIARKLQGVFRVMDEKGKRIPLAFDEWRLSAPDNAPPGAALDTPPGETSRLKVAAMGPATSVVQAVGEAAVYNMMQRQPSDFGLSSRTILYAYAAGIMGHTRDQVVLSPAALMLQMYATRERCDALGADVVSDTFDVPPKAGLEGTRAAKYIDASVRRCGKGRTDVFLVNRHLSSPIEVQVVSPGGETPADAEVTTLASEKPTDWNTYETPHRVALKTSRGSWAGGRVQLTLPPHSVTRVTW